MRFKRLTNTPYLVLFILLGAIGVGTASAMVTITLAGDVVIEGNTDIDGNLNLDGAHTGVLWDSRNPQPNLINVIDSSNDVGEFSSLTIGSDGLPVMSYYDASVKDLKFTQCANPSCTSGNTIAVDSSVDVGQYTAIAIGTDGLPIISYYDESNGSLKVARCGNLTCSLGNVISEVDTSADVGQHTSITIGLDGLPVISYYDVTNGDLKVAKCGNSSCNIAGGYTITMLDGTVDNVGEGSEIIIGVDGFPLISYFDHSNFDLKVYKCSNAACTAGSAVIADDSVAVTQEPSMTIGNDNLPVISYTDASGNNLTILKCGDSACSDGNTFNEIQLFHSGRWSSLVIGPDGFPMVSYYNPGAGTLGFAKCGDHQCTPAKTVNVSQLDGTGSTPFVGRHTSMAIGSDELPIIIHFDSSNKDLKTVKCGSSLCLSNWTRR